MPTPLAPIVNAASTISNAYIAAGSIYSMIALFVALAIGLGLVNWLWRRAKRAGHG